MNDNPATEVDATDQWPPVTAYDDDTVVSDLERAQEWLESNCGAIVTPDGHTATRLATLLAETRADQDARWRAQWEGRWTAPTSPDDYERTVHILPPAVEKLIDAAYADGSIFSENHRKG